VWMAGSAWLLLPSDRLLEVGDTLVLLDTLLEALLVVVLLGVEHPVPVSV